MKYKYKYEQQETKIIVIILLSTHHKLTTQQYIQYNFIRVETILNQKNEQLIIKLK